ncbi:MAG: hypothetical protein GY714_31170 [Desulfobacterales bacterium]|nr:hypothetical protein [Desulfobacterales bacterium]
MKFKLILVCLLTITITACSQTGEKVAQRDNFSQYKDIIDSDYKKSVNQLIKSAASVKVTDQKTYFHNVNKNEGFFVIEFKTNKSLKNSEFFTVKKNGENYKETYIISPFYRRDKKTWAIIGKFLKPGEIKIKLLVENPGDFPLLERHEFILKTPDKPEKNRSIVKNWVNEVVSRNEFYSENKSFYSDYLKMALPYKYIGKAGKYGFGKRRRGRRDRDISIVDILSGKTAIKETLQSGYRSFSEKFSKKDLPIKHVKGIEIKELPFKKMVKEKPATFKVADLVPFDNFYLNIRSLDKAIEFMKLAEKKNIFFDSFDSEYKNFHIAKKIVKQMGLEVSTLEQWFGNNIIKNIAFTTDDFFIANGTGISIIYDTKDPDKFSSQIQKRFKNYISNHKAVKEVKEYKNYRIESVQTNDKSISVFFTKIESFCIVSNSIASIKRVVDTHNKEIRSMSSNYDFLYMRNIYKTTSKDEDAFAFLSDPFIRKTLSPGFIIGKMRRISVNEDLKMIASAILFQKNEGIDSIPKIKNLIENKYLVTEAILNDLKDYSIDPVTSIPYSKSYGRIGFLKPISELSIEYISKSEERLYREFKRFYRKFWEKFFDPIGFSLKIRERVEINTTILPLINNSIYRSVEELVGGKPTTLTLKNTDDTIVSLGLKINRSKFTRELEKSLLKYDYNNRNKNRSDGILGDNITINFHDHDLLFLIDHQKIMKNTRMFTRGKKDAYFSLIAACFNLPVSVSIDLNNPQKFKNSGLINRLMMSLNNSRAFRDNEIKIHNIIPYKGQTINKADLGFYFIKMPIFYAQVGGKLVIATKLHIIKDMLLKRLKNIKDGKKDYSVKANAFIHLNPKGYNRILPQLKEFFMNRALDASKAAKKHYNAFTYSNDKNIPYSDLSRKFYGFDYNTLLGEKFYYDPLTGRVKSNITGFNSVPLDPNDFAKKTFKEQTFNNSTIEFKFTKHGIQTRVIFDR